jgi:hypothetical protein
MIKIIPSIENLRSMTDAIKWKINSDCDTVNKILKACSLLITLPSAYISTQVLPTIFWKHLSSTNAQMGDNLVWLALSKTVGEGYAQLCQGTQLIQCTGKQFWNSMQTTQHFIKRSVPSLQLHTSVGILDTFNNETKKCIITELKLLRSLGSATIPMK